MIKLSNASDAIRQLENAVQFGFPALIENVGEELDPMLEPLLLKAIFKQVRLLAACRQLHGDDASCSSSKPHTYGCTASRCAQARTHATMLTEPQQQQSLQQLLPNIRLTLLLLFSSLFGLPAGMKLHVVTPLRLILQGGVNCIRLGDATLEYSNNFRLYITTKLRSPHYLPEVSVKVCCLSTSLAGDACLLARVALCCQ